MKVLITGAHGKVGTAVTQAMIDAGHEVRTTDLTRPGYERKSEGTPRYTMADLTDVGPAYTVDEQHPAHPQDAHSLSKLFGEQFMDSAVARSDIRCISIRPSWVQNEGNYETNLSPQVDDSSVLRPSLWSYVDVYDLADAIVLAAESDLPGHELLYIAPPDNVGGHDFAESLTQHYGDAIQLRELDRKDAAGISSAKAERMLGRVPKRSWCDYLDNDGRTLS